MLEVKVPTVGESITSGILGLWSKPDGTYVKAGDPLFEIETDKVTSEVVAESAGTLKHLVKAGDTVQIGQVVANIDEKAKAPVEVAAGKGDKKEVNGSAEIPPARSQASATPPNPAQLRGKNADDLSPAVRYQSAEKSVDPATISGSGKDGRVTKGDVLAAAERRSRPRPMAAPRSRPGERHVAQKAVTSAPENRSASRLRPTGDGASHDLQ